MSTNGSIFDLPIQDMARHPVPINFLPQLIHILKVEFPTVVMLPLTLRDEDGNLHGFIYLNPTVSQSAIQLKVALSSHVVNMAINNGQPERPEREERPLYFDLGWALANLSCVVQLGGLRGADFAPTQRLTTACYLAVAAATLILSLFVLVRGYTLPHVVRKFMLLVAVFFLFVNYWMIKPHLNSG